MMRQSLFSPRYGDFGAGAARQLKAKTLLRALERRLRDVLLAESGSHSAQFVDGPAPCILVREEAADILGRVTIDAESGLYVFCELGDGAKDIVITTASEDRLLEEVLLRFREGQPARQLIDEAVGVLVGQTVRDVERKLILQTLHHCKGDPTHTAFMLDMPLVTLCNKLAAYVAESASELSQMAAEAGFGARGYRL
ncbi:MULTISPECIES: helix-turn-helix domain-containing protein [unclassified Rhizobium]|uniref:helix-turn-helix domain-containing protein n=1 Tax=unclassified Rhizobium TaxID=2613769 RepID=UPI0038187E0C